MDNKKAPVFKGLMDDTGWYEIVFGGSTWESNPPGRFPIPPTGFEDRAAHQRRTCFHGR